jgi:hypothetical protein
MDPFAFTHACDPDPVHSGSVNRLLAGRFASASQVILFALS